MIAIVVPVLRRPHRVIPAIANVAAVTEVPYRLLFVASPGDHDELRALEAAGAEFIVVARGPGDGDYARKINAGYNVTTEPYIFTGADDLQFHRGWDTAALAKMTDGIGVVGTDDLCNVSVRRGDHSTHSLVARTYANEQGTIDGPGAIYAECYPHEFVDDELVETAKARGAWVFARDSVVEHLHPCCGKAEKDELYADEPRRMREGRRIYQQRKRRFAQSPAVPVKAPISVIVATFGDESWKQIAERAVASVHTQRTPPQELIVVHGKSLAQARNEGARQATQPWLCFLDADDELQPQFMTAMSRVTGRSYGLLNPAVKFIDPNGRAKPVRMFKPKSLDQGNYLVIGTVVRADLFWGAGAFDERWEAWEDWALWRRVVELGGRIHQVPGAVYRAHERMDGRNNTIADKQGLWDRITSDFEAWKGARV